jgi:hypothetical protein
VIFIDHEFPSALWGIVRLPLEAANPDDQSMQTTTATSAARIVPRALLVAATVYAGFRALGLFAYGVLAGVSIEPSDLDEARGHVGGDLTGIAFLIGLFMISAFICGVIAIVKSDRPIPLVIAIVVFAAGVALFVPARKASLRVDCARKANTVEQVSAC